MLKTIIDRVNKEAWEKKKKKSASPFWTVCPCCKREVATKELRSKGCYACGFGRDPDSTARAENGFRMICPGCGRQVITREFEEKGCFVCAFKDLKDAH